jgi:hypothetical protein
MNHGRILTPAATGWTSLCGGVDEPRGARRFDVRDSFASHAG